MREAGALLPGQSPHSTVSHHAPCAHNRIQQPTVSACNPHNPTHTAQEHGMDSWTSGLKYPHHTLEPCSIKPKP